MNNGKEIMMVHLTKTVACAVALFAGGAFADETREVLRLTSDGSNKTNGLTTPAYWVDADGNSKPSISSDYDYLVSDDRTLRLNGGVGTFKGNSLTLGEVSGKIGRIYNYAAKEYVAFGGGGLVLANGLISTQSLADRWFGFSGDIQVQAPDAAPFKLMAGYSNAVIRLSGRLIGDSGTGLTIVYDKTVGKYPLSLVVDSDASAYRGKISLQYSGSSIYLDNTGFPGTLDLSAETSVTVSNAVTVASLHLASGAAVFLGARSSFDAEKGAYVFDNGSICATTGFSIDGPVTVKVGNGLGLPDGTSSKVALLTVPLTAVFDSENLVFDTSDVDFPNAGVKEETDADAGTRTFYLTFDPYVQLMRSDRPSRMFDTDGSFGSALTNALAWSDCRVPHEGADYFVGRVNGEDVYLRTLSRTDMNAHTSKWTFAGSSLTIGRSGSMTVLESQITIRNFCLLDGASIVNGQWSNVTFVEPIELRSGTAFIGNWCNNSMHLAGGLIGAGDLTMSGPASGTSAGGGSLMIEGPTDGWSGRISLDAQLSQTFSAYQHLVISNETNLGANLLALDPAAISLGQMGQLETRLDTVLAPESNRGLMFQSSTGRVSVAKGKRFRLGTQLTGNGVFMKAGQGTFELACPVRYGAEGSRESAKDGVDNVFDVLEGSVAVAHAEAVNGLRMSFAEGTGLSLVVDPANSDLAAWGMRLDKSVEPLSYVGEAIPLSLDFSKVTEPAAMCVGIVTVDNSMLETVKAALPAFASPWKGFRATVVCIPREEIGATTIALELSKPGLAIILR